MNYPVLRETPFDSSIMTTENNLLSKIQTKPQYLVDKFITLFAQYDLDIIMALQEKFYGASNGGSNVKFDEVNQSKYNWFLQTPTLRTVQIVSFGGNTILPATNPGLNKSRFKIYVEADYFAENDVLELENGQQIQVYSSDGSVSAGVFQYTCQIMGNDYTEIVDTDYTTAGKSLGMFYNAFPEGSEGTKMKNAYPFQMTNYLSISRASTQFTASAKNVAMVVNIPTRDGKNMPMWILRQDYQQMRLLMRYIGEAAIYGKSTMTADGRCTSQDKFGNDIITGDGIIQQLSKTNRRTYGNLTLSLIQQVLIDLSLVSDQAENNRYLAYTGAQGSTTWTNTFVNAFVPASSFVATQQGKEWRIVQDMPTYNFNGQYIGVKRFPPFDDPQRAVNNNINAVTGRSYESERFLILNMGTTNGQPHISRVRRNVSNDGDRTFVVREIDGMTSAGKSSNKSATSFDGAKKEYLSEQGIVVPNPYIHADLRKF